MIAPLLSVHDPAVLPAVRELISENPETACWEATTTAKLLYATRLLPHQPEDSEVEAALEALRLDSGEISA
ncbi:MAG: hypothetical protein H0X71_06475 [Rubrobacter sp.]|nr:hypothetical protein [Rubrobacter sp.]